MDKKEILAKNKALNRKSLDEREQRVYRSSFGFGAVVVGILCLLFSIFDNFREAYQGKWDSEKDFAEFIVDECGMLHGTPDFVKNYFDYEAFARDLFIDDYYFDSGFVFRRM